MPTGKWLPVPKETNSVGVVREGNVIPAVLDPAQPYLAEQIGPNQVAQGRSISIVNAKGDSDQIIPTYITTAMPKWFGLVFLLTLLAAAMSTLSSQFHTLGTAAGRDVVRDARAAASPGAARTARSPSCASPSCSAWSWRCSIGYYAKKEQFVVSIIARATAIFFGLCASTFLPAFVGGIFFRRITTAGAIASMLVGFGGHAVLAGVRQGARMHRDRPGQDRASWPTRPTGRWWTRCSSALPLSSLTADRR